MAEWFVKPVLTGKEELNKIIKKERNLSWDIISSCHNHDDALHRNIIYLRNDDDDDDHDEGDVACEPSHLIIIV